MQNEETPTSSPDTDFTVSWQITSISNMSLFQTIQTPVVTYEQPLGL